MRGGYYGRVERGSWRAALLFNSEHLIFPWHVLVGSGFALQPLINFRVFSRSAGSTGKPQENFCEANLCVQGRSLGRPVAASHRGPLAGWPPSLRSPLLPRCPLPGRAACHAGAHRSWARQFICLCWVPELDFWAGARAGWGRGKDEPCSDAIAPQICSRFKELEWFGLTPSLAEEPGKPKRRAWKPARSTENCEELVEQSFFFFFFPFPLPQVGRIKRDFWQTVRGAPWRSRALAQHPRDYKGCSLKENKPRARREQERAGLRHREPPWEHRTIPSTFPAGPARPLPRRLRCGAGSARLSCSSPPPAAPAPPPPHVGAWKGGGKSPSSLTRKSALFPQKPQLLRAENTSGRPSDTHRCAFVNPHTRRGGRRMASEGKSAGPRRMAGGCSLPKAALLLRPPFVSGPCLIPRSGSKSRESWRRPK